MVESPIGFGESHPTVPSNSIEDILSNENGFLNIMRANPEVIHVIESLKTGYRREENNQFYELWIRALDLLDGLASKPPEGLEEDEAFMRRYVEGDIKSAMAASMNMREIDKSVLESLRMLNRQQVFAHEIYFYELIHSIMNPEDFKHPDVHNYL